jgi:methyl-accepting chemotaxis protein
MFRGMKIATKIMAAFGVVLALVGVLAAVSYLGVGRVDDIVNNFSERKLPATRALLTLRQAETSLRANGSILANSSFSAELRETARKHFASARERMAQSAKAYAALPHGAKTRALWNEYQGPAERFQRDVVAFEEAVRERDRAGATVTGVRMVELERKITDVFSAMYASSIPAAEALGKLVDQTEADAKDLDEASAQTQRSVLVTLAVVVSVCAALLVVLALLLSRSITGVIRALVSESARLTSAVEAGKLDTRGEVEKVGVEFQGIVKGMNQTLDAYAKPMRVITGYLTRIAKGDVPPPITEPYAGDFEVIVGALNRCVTALSGLIGEMTRMTEEQAKGDLDAFVPEEKFEGAYRTMAKGVNDSTRMHVKNLLDGLAVLGKYGDGDFKPVMRPLPGKQALMNETFDRIRANLMAVAAEVQALTRAAVDGKLATRADASRFGGDWKALVEGVNATLDAVIEPLNVAAKYVEQISNGEVPPKITDSYAGDFSRIKDSLNRCIDAVNRLVVDANQLAEAAIAGKLSTRADASRHQGDFRKIVDGVNRTLDAVIAPVNEAAGVLERLSQRDLRARMNGSYQGDHARIKESVNVTAQALHEALTQVAAAVEQVSSAAAQIASSSQAVASGASEQASSLAETTSSIESVAGQVKASADNAQQANTLVQTARAAATEGAGAVEQMQGAMGRIKQSAEGTSLIIKDVSDIAFQTNLLALNAAVEAARAGEAGRGFAVVAEEVRSLALRAKEAATKTEELIRGSVKQAAEGEVAAKHVAGKLGEIVQGVEKVTAIVSEIAAAANEQTAAVEQVNKAIGEMDKVTQQNAASAEESSSAASELSGQAEELAAMVGAFQLDRAAVRAATASAHAPKGAPALHAPRPSAPAKTNGVKNGHAPHPTAHADQVFPMDSDQNLRDF